MALSQREKALILIPVALGALIGFYSYVHEPLMTRRAEAETKLEDVERELKQGQRQLSQEGDLEARRQAVGAREQVVDASVPGKNAAALFVWYLSQAEMRSGGRVKGIQVAERRAVDPAHPEKQVQAAECGASVGAASGQASGGTGQASGSTGKASGSTGQASGSTEQASGSTGQASDSTGQATGSTAQSNGSADCSQPLPPGSIVVISMELKLAGQFGQQLHFAQMLEEMPLFLANDKIALVRTTAPDWQKASGLITEGKSANAFNMLAASPEVEGSYAIQIYFKQAKVGPATSDMSFATEAGRKDPFQQDGVAEFTQYVQDAFSGHGFAPDPSSPQQWVPTPEQLG